ncbi:hypothetical protein [Xanthobacter sediminis]
MYSDFVVTRVFVPPLHVSICAGERADWDSSSHGLLSIVSFGPRHKSLLLRTRPELRAGGHAPLAISALTPAAQQA